MWPGLTLAMVAFYWSAVVLKAADLGVRRRRSPNAWPHDRFERLLIFAWVVNITIWLYVPARLLSGSASIWVVPLVSNVLLAGAGAILGLVALAVSVVAWLQMGDEWRLATSEEERTSLVRQGLFGLVRHPIYSAQALLLIASVLMLPTPLYLVLAVAHLGCIAAKVRVEEAYLHRTHGESYVRYAREVGKFVPRAARRASDARAGR